MANSINGFTGAMDGELVELLSVAVLRSAFVEPDPLVRIAMWKPLLLFLKGNDTLLRFILHSDQDAHSTFGL